MPEHRKKWSVEHLNPARKWVVVATFDSIAAARDHIATQKSPRRYRITNSAELDTETPAPGGEKQ